MLHDGVAAETMVFRFAGLAVEVGAGQKCTHHAPAMHTLGQGDSQSQSCSVPLSMHLRTAQ